MLSFLLIAAAASAAPAPSLTPVLGPLRTFGDWTVACDNVQRCEATSLIPDDGVDDTWNKMLAITRDPGPEGAVGIWIESDAQGTVALTVDGRTVAPSLRAETPAALTAADSHIEILGDAAFAAAAALAHGNRADIVANGRTVTSFSLAGLSAALRFIDDQQGRAETISALVATGPRPVHDVPLAAALPRIPMVNSAPFAERRVPDWVRRAVGPPGCGIEIEGEIPREAEIYALDARHWLVLNPCESGAYNFTSTPFIVTRAGATVARFDLPPGRTENLDEPVLVNAMFDPVVSELGSYAKSRGLGDCGASDRYVWDGTMFRLIEARRMEECRGSTNWLGVWHAEPVPTP